MGIRFVCPNGHPLHVKAELAGKRGICPECKAKFLIPAPSDLTAANSEASPAPAASPTASAVQAESTPVAPHASQPAAPSPVTSGGTAIAPPPVASPPTNANTAEPEAPPSVSTPSNQPSGVPMWYVRPAAGGQFGPVDEPQLKQWASEGRIGADAYVWRTGWPDWRRATEATEYLPHLAPAMPPNSSATGPAEQRTAAADESSPASAAVARYQRRKRQSAQGQTVAAIVLIVMALILAGILVWVLQMTSASNESTPQPVEAPPIVTPAEVTTEETNDEEPEVEE